MIIKKINEIYGVVTRPCIMCDGLGKRKLSSGNYYKCDVCDGVGLVFIDEIKTMIKMIGAILIK